MVDGWFLAVAGGSGAVARGLASASSGRRRDRSRTSCTRLSSAMKRFHRAQDRIDPGSISARIGPVRCHPSTDPTPHFGGQGGFHRPHGRRAA